MKISKPLALSLSHPLALECTLHTTLKEKKETPATPVAIPRSPCNVRWFKPDAVRPDHRLRGIAFELVIHDHRWRQGVTVSGDGAAAFVVVNLVRFRRERPCLDFKPVVER